jgi:hypothetical protein
MSAILVRARPSPGAKRADREQKTDFSEGLEFDPHTGHIFLPIPPDLTNMTIKSCHVRFDKRTFLYGTSEASRARKPLTSS